jgi:hypothetical protein
VRKFVTLGLIQLALLAGCGGGGYGGTTTPPPPTSGSNVEPITVNVGPNGTAINTAYLSVTICVPGSTTNCQTIDNVEVDTGSSGLRILAEKLPMSFISALPQEMDSSNHPFAECLPFADGSSWGSLRVADLKLPTSGKTVASLNVQIIGDGAYPRPANNACPGPAEDTVIAFGANGILGVGPFEQDCGSACVSGIPTTAIYYDCASTSTCAAMTATLAQQVPNPVALFSSDNNGVLVQMGSVGASGATTATGSLIFGIGTQSNNALGSAIVLPADPSTGWINATLMTGTQYSHSYLDSGSNGIFFSSSITTCPSPNQAFYCANPAMPETATLQGENGALLVGSTTMANFTIGDANTMFSTVAYTAFPQLGGTNPSDTSSLDLGMPFFYGHSVFTAIEAHMAAGTMGPYFAF